MSLAIGARVQWTNSFDQVEHGEIVALLTDTERSGVRYKVRTDDDFTAVLEHAQATPEA